MAYYVRSPIGDERVICDPCGTIRWGDPFADDDGATAFAARLKEPVEWCWSPVWSARPTPCTDCKANVDPL